MKLGVTNIATNIVYKYKMFHDMVHTNKQKMWTLDIHESPGAIPLHWIATIDTPNPKVQTVTVNSKFFLSFVLYYYYCTWDVLCCIVLMKQKASFVSASFNESRYEIQGFLHTLFLENEAQTSEKKTKTVYIE